MQIDQGQGEPIGNACIDLDASNPEDRNGEKGEEEVMTQKTYIPPSLQEVKQQLPYTFSHLEEAQCCATSNPEC